MKDYFHWGFGDRILFYGWISPNSLTFVGSWFLILFCSIFHEYLRYIRLKLTASYRTRCLNGRCCTCRYKICCLGDPASHKDEGDGIFGSGSSVAYENINQSRGGQASQLATTVPLNTSKMDADKNEIGKTTTEDREIHVLNRGSIKTDDLFKTLPKWAYTMILVLLYAIHTTLSFILMLVFMTFNVWLCLAVISGLSIGYTIFFLGTMASCSTKGGSEGENITNEILRNDLACQPCCQ